MKCNENCEQGRQCDCVPDYDLNKPTYIEKIYSILMVALIIGCIIGLVAMNIFIFTGLGKMHI